MKNLYKIALFLSLTLYTPVPEIYSQDLLYKGFKVGINLANISGEDVGDTETNTGPVLGAYVVLGITDRFSFQPEVLYSEKGWELFDGVVKVNISYLDIPLLARLTLLSNSKTSLDFYLGPTFSIKLKGTMETSGVETDFVVKKTDFGVTFGADFRYDQVIFEARFTQGLSSIDASAADLDFKNRVITFLVGLSMD